MRNANVGAHAQNASTIHCMKGGALNTNAAEPPSAITMNQNKTYERMTYFHILSNFWVFIFFYRHFNLTFSNTHFVFLNQNLFHWTTQGYRHGVCISKTNKQLREKTAQSDGVLELFTQRGYLYWLVEKGRLDVQCCHLQNQTFIGLFPVRVLNHIVEYLL